MLREEHLLGTLMKMKLGEVLRFKAALASKVGSCPVCLHCIQCHTLSQTYSKSSDCDDHSNSPDKYSTDSSENISDQPKSTSSSSKKDEPLSKIVGSEIDDSNELEKSLKLETNKIKSSNNTIEDDKKKINVDADEDK